MVGALLFELQSCYDTVANYSLSYFNEKNKTKQIFKLIENIYGFILMLVNQNQKEFSALPKKEWCLAEGRHPRTGRRSKKAHTHTAQLSSIL